jgi:hypothetical protein
MDLRRPLRTPRARAVRAGAVAGLIGLGAVAGCASETYPPTVGGYTTVYATDIPPDMAVYPRAPYARGYAYLVGNSWYYPTGGRWVVLQEEPPELYRYRTTYVQAAPPAYRAPPAYYPRQYAPPAQYGYPPPAVRVR